MTITHVGPWDIHDARIQAVTPDGAQLHVDIRSCEGRQFRITFTGVQTVRQESPVGMMLYALNRDDATSPPTFTLVNWDEDDPSLLEVVADGFEEKS